MESYAPDQYSQLLHAGIHVAAKLSFHAPDGGDGVLESILPGLERLGIGSFCRHGGMGVVRLHREETFLHRFGGLVVPLISGIAWHSPWTTPVNDGYKQDINPTLSIVVT